MIPPDDVRRFFAEYFGMEKDAIPMGWTSMMDELAVAMEEMTKGIRGYLPAGPEVAGLLTGPTEVEPEESASTVMDAQEALARAGERFRNRRAAEAIAQDTALPETGAEGVGDLAGLSGNTAFSVGIRERYNPNGWGDLGRKVRVVGDGKPFYKRPVPQGKRKVQVKDIKDDVMRLAFENVSKQSNVVRKKLDGDKEERTFLMVDGVLHQIAKSGLLHSANNAEDATIDAIARVGDLLNVSIEVPGNFGDMHYRVAAMRLDEPYFVLFTERNLGGKMEVRDVQILKSVSAKKAGAPTQVVTPRELPANTTSVANLKDAWETLFLDGMEQHLKQKEAKPGNTAMSVGGFGLNANARAEMEKVRKQYEGTDQWMKAPNGKPTKLTRRLWLLVRTPAFKRWFGDWENDPANASKVVDENGEPLMVHHGSIHSFTVFGQDPKLNKFKERPTHSYMVTPSQDGARRYGNIADLFVNARNVADYRSKEAIREAISRNWEEAANILRLIIPNRDFNSREEVVYFLDGATTKDGRLFQGYENSKLYLYGEEFGRVIQDVIEDDALRNLNADGYLFLDNSGGIRHDSYGLFAPQQLKSATDNTGNFDPMNPDIRLSVGSRMGKWEADPGFAAVRPADVGRQRRAGAYYPDIGRWIANTAFSIGERRKAEYRAVIGKKRPDLPADEVERFMVEMDKLGNTKAEKAALHWFVKGGLQLPEDGENLKKAIEVSAAFRIDPFRTGTPQEVLRMASQMARARSKELQGPFLGPEDIGLTLEEDYGNGLKVYSVKEYDQDDIWRLMRSQGYIFVNPETNKVVASSPWCLLEPTESGSRPSQSAVNYWGGDQKKLNEYAQKREEHEAWVAEERAKWEEEHKDDEWPEEFPEEDYEYDDSDEDGWANGYTGAPKMAAFFRGRIVAFSGVLYEGDSNYHANVDWWDLDDKEHGYDLEFFWDGTAEQMGLTHLPPDTPVHVEGNEADTSMTVGDEQNGIYEFYSDNELTERALYKDGKRVQDLPLDDVDDIATLLASAPGNTALSVGAPLEIPAASLKEAQAAIRILAERHTKIKMRNGDIVQFSAQSNKMHNSKAVHESDDADAHFAAVAAIKKICEAAEFIYDEPPRNGSPDIRFYRKYATPVIVNGQGYIAKLTAKVYPQEGNDNIAYSIEAISLERIGDRGINDAITKGKQHLDPIAIEKVTRLVNLVKSHLSGRENFGPRGANTALSVGERPGPAPTVEPGGDVREAGEGALAWLRRKFVHSQTPVFDAVRRVMGVGREPPDALNVEAAAKNVHGKIRARQEMLQRAYLEPLKAILAQPGMDRKRFDDYALALHALERNRMIQERSVVVDPTSGEVVDLGVEAGSGVTNAWAERVIREIQRDPFAQQYKEAANILAEMNRFVLRGAVADGLLTEAQARTWMRLSPHYVPLKSGGAAPGAIHKRATGRFTRPDSVLVNSMRQAYATVRNGELNRVNKTMADWIREYDPNGEQVGGTVPESHKHAKIKMTDPQYVPKGSTAEALLRERGIRLVETEDKGGYWVDTGVLPNALKRIVRESVPQGDDIVTFWENGERKFIRFEGKRGRDGRAENEAARIADALNFKNVLHKEGRFWDAIRGLTRWKANVSTSWNPTFIVRNMGADVFNTANLMMIEGKYAELARTMRNYPEALNRVERSSHAWVSFTDGVFPLAEVA